MAKDFDNHIYKLIDAKFEEFFKSVKDKELKDKLYFCFKKGFMFAWRNKETLDDTSENLTSELYLALKKGFEYALKNKDKLKKEFYDSKGAYRWSTKKK